MSNLRLFEALKQALEGAKMFKLPNNKRWEKPQLELESTIRIYLIPKLNIFTKEH